MPSRRRLPLAAVALLPMLAGCGGGGRQTAVVTRTQTVVRTVTVTTTPTTTAPQTTPVPAPADEHAHLSLHDAELVLGARGFAPLTERDWHPDQTLKVLVGIRHPGANTETGSEQAFFFVGATFIGTDTQDASGRVEVVSQRDVATTLSYGLYHRGDAIGNPTAGSAQVTYVWDGTHLLPQGAIPPADPSASPSRR